MKDIYHLGHEHPLSLILLELYRLDCKACLRRLHLNDEIYFCNTCVSYAIHRSCAHEMPHRIQHSFHHEHYLTPSLSKKFQSFQCFSCKKKFLEVVTFQCSKCDFFLCIQCALKPDISCTREGEDVSVIPCICHEVPMTLEEKKHEDEIECYACHLPCSGQTYTCNTCKYFFHKSCMEFPPQITHPFHPSHPLRRHMASPGQSTITKCKSCHRSCPFFIVFQCNECDFNICPKCFFLKSTIKYQSHNHPLCLMDTKGISLDHCDGTYYCRQMVVLDEFKKCTRSFMLYCVECDFNLHLLCGRLPCTIKDECRVHLLTLVDLHIEDGSDEHYCDVCEKKRDPRLCAYSCAKCKYVAHVHCVISKVTQVLEGEFGNNVELRRVGEGTSNMAINEGAIHDGMETLKDLINKISKQVVEERLKLSFYWNGNDSFEDHQSGYISDKNDDEFCAYTDEDVGRLELRIYSNAKRRRLKLESNELAMEIVNVEGFEIPWSLAPVLRHILAKYRNTIVPKPKDKPSPLESFAYFVLCRLANSLFRTSIVDITEDLLQQWVCHLCFLEITMQMRCEFLKRPVLKLICIYSGREAKRQEDDLMRKLPEKIAMHEAELKRCKELLRKLTAKERLENSELVEYCKREASNVNKWKTALGFRFH